MVLMIRRANDFSTILPRQRRTIIAWGKARPSRHLTFVISFANRNPWKASINSNVVTFNVQSEKKRAKLIPFNSPNCKVETAFFPLSFSILVNLASVESFHRQHKKEPKICSTLVTGLSFTSFLIQTAREVMHSSTFHVAFIMNCSLSMLQHFFVLGDARKHFSAVIVARFLFLSARN